MRPLSPQSRRRRPDWSRWQGWQRLWRQDRALALALLILLADAVLAPAVWAASGGRLTLSASVWLGLLLLTTAGLSVYLFYVMFKPEAF